MSGSRKSLRRKSVVVALAVAGSCAPSLLATTKTWVANNGNWTGLGNWSPTGAPANGDTVIISNTDGTVRVITYDNNLARTFASLTLDLTNNSTGGGATITMSANTLNVSDSEVIGNNGNGFFQQTGGTNNSTGSIYLGNGGLSGSGTYNISNNAVLNTLSGNFWVGANGNGYVNQSGGTVTIGVNTPQDLYLGYSANTYGEYNMYDTNSKLTVNGNIYVGTNGQGKFKVDGISNVATIHANNLFIAAASTSSGQVSMNNGQASFAGGIYVGGNNSSAGGGATMTLTGGSVLANGPMVVYSGGSVSLQGGSLTVASLQSSGSFSWYGGGLIITQGNLNIDNSGPMRNYLALNPSMGLTVDGTLTIGGTSAGTFIQDANLVYAVGPGGSGGVLIGSNGNSGNYYLETGSLSAASETIGANSQMYQTGGLNQVNGVFWMSGGGSSYTLRNGQLNYSGPYGAINGTMNQSGGAVTGSALYVGYFVNAAYSMSGGTLNINNYEVIGAYASGITPTFYQSGGTNTIIDQGSGAILYIGWEDSAGAYFLSGPSAHLIAGDVFVGNYFTQGNLDVSQGKADISGTLFVANFAGTGVSLESGGTLNAGTLALSFPGQLNWTGGTLGITGANGLGISVNGVLGPALTIDSSKTLNVTNTLTIDLNASLNLAGGTVSVGTLDTGHTASRLNWSSGTLTVTGGLTVANGQPLGSALALTAGQTLNVPSLEAVGDTSSGSLIINGGINNAGLLVLGNTVSTSGGATMTAGTLNVTNTEFIGMSGTGYFMQTGGNHSAGTLMLGYAPGSTGNMTLAAGTIAANYESIGSSGSGTFTQTGGTNTVGFQLSLGAASSGVYNLTGGNLIDNSTMSAVGNGGTGVFNQSGGAYTLTSANGQNMLLIGRLSSGTYNLSGGSLTDTGGIILVGSGGTGVLNMSGGSLSALALYIFNASGSQVYFSGGSISVPNIYFVDDNRFNWSGGTLNLLPGGTFSLNTLTVPMGGTLNYNGGAFAHALVNDGTTNVNANFVTGPLTNYGTINFAGTIISNVGLKFENDGLTIGYGVINTGTFDNESQFTQTGGNLVVTGSVGLTNNGTIDLEAGRIMQISGANLTNTGTLNLNGAAVNGSVNINNSGGTISGPGTLNLTILNSGTILVPNGTTKINSFTNNGVIEMAGNSAALGSAQATVTNTSTIEGFGKISAAVANYGTIESTGGTLIFSGPVTNTVGGEIRTDQATKVLMQNFDVNAGLINLVGGTFDNGQRPLSNTGSITGYGGLSTGGLTNNGNITLTGGTSTVNGAVINSSGKTISIKYQPALFTGPITNNGTIKTTNTTVTFTSTYSGNNYISDPATNIFQNNVTIVSGGSMTGDNGDVFNFAGGTVANHGTFNNGGLLQSSVNVSNDGNFIQSGAQSWANGTVFTNSAGTATFASDAGSNTSSPLSINVTGGNVNFASTQHLSSISLSSGTASVSGNHNVLSTNHLSISGSSALDLTNNAMIVNYTGSTSPVNSIRASLTSAFDGSAWDGNGITSSTAANNSDYTTALGYAEASDLAIDNGGTFDGQTIANEAVIIKYTYNGDSNLDGEVTTDDFFAFVAGFNGQGSGWTYGDYNYDGVIDTTDLFIFVPAFNLDTQNNALSELILADASLSESQRAALLSVVPEPGAMGVLAVGVVLNQLLPLRRRRRDVAAATESASPEDAGSGTLASIALF